MAFALGPKAQAAGYRLEAFAAIGSTSAEALKCAGAGDPSRLWVAATAQTDGHGRRGRPWQTPPGNLAASLLFPGPAEAAMTPTLGFVAGLALADAIRAVARGKMGNGLQLKWPNDVLIDGAKVAGILLESAAAGSVVIGIGVNVRHAPEGVPYPATSLAACGIDAAAETLFHALAEAWVNRIDAWDEGRGFAAIRGDWLDLAAGLGGAIAVRVGENAVRGTFETIDTEGRLVVRRRDGARMRVTAGEVHFGDALTMAQ